MKVLFLDIDGVLNSELYYRKRYKKIKSGKIILKDLNDFDRRLLEFDKQAVKWLNIVVKNTGCKIVISSTWRKMDEGWQGCWDLLKHQGFIGEVIGATKFLGCERGYEIANWLEEHPETTSYVIVDDDSDMTDYQRLHHFAWCDRYIGFTPTTAYKCEYMLNGKIRR